MWFLKQSRTAKLRRNLAHADGFRSRLETDRLRADRMGIALTLVAVKWREGDDPAESTARVFDLIDSRLRATDEVGRLNHNEVGIVLWDTDEDGATVFVDRLLKAAPVELKLEATLFVYPQRGPSTRRSDDKSGQNNSHDDSRNDERDSETEEPSSEQAATNENLASTASVTSQFAVEQLEPAMARTMSPIRRGIDFVGALCGLMLASPILLAAAAAIKISDRGPVFFMQERAGLGGNPFRIYKLRTMCIDAEAKKSELLARSEQDGAAFKMEHDPRVFKVGNFLRRTSIDELPQLINVLRGEMSLVGPRPLPIEEAERVAGWQRRRLDVMPGLTCIWQVEGRSRVSFIEWMRMDMRYIQRRGLLSDLQLMFATVPAVLMRKGAK